MKKYNKLVRDLIPEIIQADNKKCKTKIVEGKEKEIYLENKLQEEVNEYFQDKNLEELADVMEVLFGLADSLGYTEKDLIEKRNEKLKLRGGFKKGIILEEVN
ncbi:nucleoside triphosphate pyrophosphohydrolase [Clostridium thermobutyricum]|uniref:Phosphoribosyl-ATP pyrophosphohydrolase n=1 Tax=Clostridium thermobutyricum TaxID=29372 RepID=N9Y5Q4_9CLOT|nr:nucleoside triphosphate pyrophosphohydrolase [Clostridium thermobutyricum]ENZ03534.1 hypothetical protein HMPREF1092_00721 [Clostridium thermobutyricum]